MLNPVRTPPENQGGETMTFVNAVHIGHSTGGGEVARYVAKYGQPQGRVAKAVLVSSVPPLMVKTANNPDGTPIEVFDGFRQTLAANRSQFFLDMASGPFYGFNRPGAKASQGVIQNWWRQGMLGSAKAHYDGIKTFSETDQTEDLKAITVPTLVLQGDDDQVVPTRTRPRCRPSCSKTARSRSIRAIPTACAPSMQR
jgi:non-heme chloroperoxidase